MQTAASEKYSCVSLDLINVRAVRMGASPDINWIK